VKTFTATPEEFATGAAARRAEASAAPAWILEAMSHAEATRIFAANGVAGAGQLDAAALKEAWRRLALQWHPDRAGQGSMRKAQDINAAYDVLKVPGSAQHGWHQHRQSKPYQRGYERTREQEQGHAEWTREEEQRRADYQAGSRQRAQQTREEERQAAEQTRARRAAAEQQRQANERQRQANERQRQANAYWTGKRREGHRTTPSEVIKPMAEDIVSALLDEGMNRRGFLGRLGGAVAGAIAAPHSMAGAASAPSLPAGFVFKGIGAGLYDPAIHSAEAVRKEWEQKRQQSRQRAKPRAQPQRKAKRVWPPRQQQDREETWSDEDFMPEKKAEQLVDRLIESDVDAWWKPDVAPDDFEAREARRQEQSRLQTSMNKVSKFEPQSRALLDLVLGRDDMLKERNARHRLEAELSKHGLSTDDVDDFIFKTRGSRDNMLSHLHVGPEADDAGKALTPRCGACPHDFSQVQPGDLIGIKTKDGKTHYFSGPLGGLPTHIANPTAR